MLLAKKIANEKCLSTRKLSALTGMGFADIAEILRGQTKPYRVQALKLKAALEYDGEADELFLEMGNIEDIAEFIERIRNCKVQALTVYLKQENCELLTNALNSDIDYLDKLIENCTWCGKELQ